MTRIYLIRHGETEYNQKGCYYGWTDCSLAKEGIEQAVNLKKAFQNIEYDVILSSDLKRAIETARTINDGKEPEMDVRLRELNFGKWEGLNYQDIMDQYTEHWNSWIADWVNATPTEGESVACMYSRITQYMKEILEQYQDKSIVIVSHLGTLRMIAVYLLGLSLDKMWCFSFEHGKFSLLEVQENHCSIKGFNNML
jgi:alpha-ribazole phosphatase